MVPTRLLSSGHLKGRRVGIVSNPASVDAEFTHIVDALLAAPGVTVGAIFGPAARLPFRRAGQHDRDAAHQRLGAAGAGVLALQRDARADGGDAARTSTCWSSTCRTLARASTPTSTPWPTACGRAPSTASTSSSATGPIPIGGVDVEGPDAGRGLRVVRRPVPHPDASRHDDRRAGAVLQRALRHQRAARGDRHGGLVARTCTATPPGIPFVMPSPNIPTLDSAIVYPGTVLFEGTMASEGRGTTRPFELVGAPWVEAEKFAATMNARRLPGVHFRAAVFEPTFQKHAKNDLRRLPDPRARPRGVQAGADRRGADRRDSRRRSRRRLPGGRRRTSTSTTRSRSTSCRDRRRCAPRSMPACAPKSWRGPGRSRAGRSRNCASSTWSTPEPWRPRRSSSTSSARC